jgi:pimeloyl-ACP methyl ester carboxylesterase
MKREPCIHMLDGYYPLISVSPDQRFTLAVRIERCSGSWRTLLLCFERGVLRSRREMPPVINALAAWSQDSSCYAVWVGGALICVDLHQQERCFSTQLETQVRGLYIAHDQTIWVHTPGYLCCVDFKSGKAAITHVSIVGWAASGRHFAYCDTNRTLYFSNGTELAHTDLLQGALWEHARLDGHGDCVIVPCLQATAARTVRLVVVPTGVAASPWIAADVQMLAKQWMVGGQGSIVGIEGSSGIDVVRTHLADGRREVLGTVAGARCAVFVNSIDGSLHLHTEHRRQRRIHCVEATGIRELWHTSDDVAGLQVSNTGVCALISAHRRSRGWVLSIEGTAVRPARGAQRAETLSTRVRRSPGGHSVRGSAASTAAVLYVPSVFAAERIWAQSPFFQHALFCLVQQLHREGCGYFVLGTLGECRHNVPEFQRRFRERLQAALQELRGFGYQRIAVLSGSLGSHALLQNADLLNQAAALMLLSPVLHLTPLVATIVGMDPSCAQANAVHLVRRRAQEVHIPTLIAHGTCDEVSPAGHVSLFMANLPQAVPRQLLSIDGEGHVFQRLTTWSRVIADFHQFARERLELVPDAAHCARLQAHGTTGA